MSNTPIPRSCAHAFLEMLCEMSEGNPADHQKLREAADSMPARGSAIENEAERVILSLKAATEWAPIALRNAGFDYFAECLEEAGDEDQATDVMINHRGAVPMRGTAGPKNLDDYADLARDGAWYSCKDPSRTSGAAARALHATAQSVRIARQSRPELEPMSMADEAIRAAHEAVQAGDLSK